MPFLDDLVTKVGRGDKSILTQEFRYRTKAGGVITVPKGFSTDFASIPRAARWLITGVDDTRKAAVIHDYLYKHRRGTRKHADKLFLEAMAESGVAWWKRQAMYWAVRSGGWVHWNA